MNKHIFMGCKLAILWNKQEFLESTLFYCSNRALVIYFKLMLFWLVLGSCFKKEHFRLNQNKKTGSHLSISIKSQRLENYFSISDKR